MLKWLKRSMLQHKIQSLFKAVGNQWRGMGKCIDSQKTMVLATMLADFIVAHQKDFTAIADAAELVLKDLKNNKDLKDAIVDIGKDFAKNQEETEEALAVVFED